MSVSTASTGNKKNPTNKRNNTISIKRGRRWKRKSRSRYSTSHSIPPSLPPPPLTQQYLTSILGGSESTLEVIHSVGVEPVLKPGGDTKREWEERGERGGVRMVI